MANDRPGGDWRHSGGGSPRPTPGPKTSRRSWQPGASQASAAPGRARSRGGRLLIAGAVTGALAGLVILLIWLFWPARYPQLALVGAGNSDSLALPENAAGANTAQELTSWAGEGHDRDRPRLDADPAVTVDAAGARIAIDSRPKNLVVVFSAHGGADGAGPYLWMAAPDAKSATEAHKVRIRDIIDRVGEARRGKATLLVFDATRVTTSWPHGLLLNDFSRALKELDAQIESIPGLAVICASDDDQRSWLFEERGVSVFGHYLLQAMRGAGHDRGQRVTAASAFAHTKGEVERWSIANRAEKQSPILLPQASGQSRAELIDLAAAPAGGYQNPPAISSPGSVPVEFVDAWKTANDLARQVPAPEADNPAKWREYLDLLLRQERLLRLGANTAAIRDRVAALAAQLQNPLVGREPACLSASIPTGRALGRAPLFSDGAGKQEADRFRDEFDRVWKPLDPSVSRADLWAALLRKYPGRETPARIAAAERVLTRLIDEGPTADNLATAEAVLAAIFAGEGLTVPVEVHLARMLHLHLLPGKNPRPDAALLRDALSLRREAEEAAWVFMAEPKEYPYSEVVYPWVRAQIESGDRNRQLGQDLLFGTDPRMWTEAGKLFAASRADYAEARARGSKVAAALASRDRVFSRLPYYSRWLAAYRGARSPVEVDEFIGRAEKAFRNGHHITDLIDKDAPSVDRLGELDTLRAETDGHFKAVADAFDADVARLTPEPLPSNWHAIDNALTVPFISAQRRGELLGFLRHVSYQLESNRQQLEGSQVPAPRAREVAARSGRLAVALLGETSPERQLPPNPDVAALRTVGDQIGERFRSLAKESRGGTDRSARAPSIRDGTSSLAEAALRGRLADAAAPLGNPDPVAALQRQRRQSFLLWQAQRTIAEGWANVGSTSTRTRPANPDEWYCRKSALNLIGTAESLIRENATELTGRPAESLAPAELDRWLVDCRQEAARRPAVLVLSAPPARDVADEPDWTFAFSMSAEEKAAVGYPVSWLAAPGKPYPQADPAALARRVEADFPAGRLPAARHIRFVATEKLRDEKGTGKLSTALFYRGHIYENTTEVLLVGAPTRIVTYTPPQGAGAFGIRTDRAAVAGAVTILVDLSSSMKETIDERGTTRLEEAKKGLQQVLKQLPPGTTVTIAPFYGDSARTALTAEPLGTPLVMNGANWERVYENIRNAKAAGGSTPLAGAIAKVLSKKHEREFWPADAATGSRTLIVLTDGVDNWGKITNGPSVYPDQLEPGRLALQALLATPDDVGLHIVYFGMTSESNLAEQKLGKAQFEILTRSEHFLNLTPQRTPAQLWTGINDAAALAEVCRNAMLPRFRYARGEQAPDLIEATIAGDSGMRVTPPLDPGVYSIRGLHNPQAVQLRAADRILLEGRRRDGKFELALPAYGHEVATRRDLPRTGAAGTGGILAAIPEFKLANFSNHADVSLAVTLEEVGERNAQNLLEMKRPRLAWFDVRYADGSSFDKDLTPAIEVRNRWPLWAPGWDIKLHRWDRAGVDRASAKHPAIKAYWLDGFPVSPAKYPVDLTDLPGSFERAQKTMRVGETEVTLISLGREEYAGSGLPKGLYLTVRMKYGKPGELVYLRPGNLKGTDQPFALYEQHSYYDGHARYTARFGPIFDDEPNKNVALELHSIAALREDSEKKARAVELRLPAGELPNHEMPAELRVEPRKK
jgi:hypothetical protein